jgi:hypothetical protein
VKAADLTDVFAWMSPDAQKVNFILSIGRNVQPAEAQFMPGTVLQYVLHTTSRQGFDAPPGPEVAIICTFSDGAPAPAQTIQCWVGNEAYVTGNASNPDTGLTSTDGKVRVFAGLRNDSFFFNLPGFRAAARMVTSALVGDLGPVTFDAAGCPALGAATSGALVNQLRTAIGGGPATNSFGRFNVIAIVVSIDKTVITKNGPVLSVSASTNRP